MRPRVFGRTKSQWVGKVSPRNLREPIYTWLLLPQATQLELISLLTEVILCLNFENHQLWFEMPAKL
jgi:hypothetical protein